MFTKFTKFTEIYETIGTGLNFNVRAIRYFLLTETMAPSKCGISLLSINRVIYFVVVVCEQYQQDKTHNGATRWSRFIGKFPVTAFAPLFLTP